jgi:hypothetical protein
MTQVSVTVTRCDDADDNHHYLLSQGSGPIRIGRSPANHVKVDFRGISAYHLEIRAGLDGPDNGLVRACDLSMNGTTLELPGGEKISLQKEVETSIPDGAKLLIPGKVKKAEGHSDVRRSYLVRWHRVQSNGEKTQEDPETPALPSTSVAPPVKIVNGSTPPPSDLPVPVPEPQARGKDAAASSSPTHSDAIEDSPAAQPPVHAVANISMPEGARLRPKAQPKRPAAPAPAQSGGAEDSSSSSGKAQEQKTTKKVTQKSRSRDNSGAKGGQSKSRGRKRGRQRKRSRSGSGSRSCSRNRRRKRRRSKSRGRKRKRKRSKSRSSSSSSGSKSDEDDDKASGAAAAANPMTNMQPQWGMHWGAQSAWGWNPYMQGSVQPQMNIDIIKQQIYFMYQRFKPEKLPEYEKILNKYKGSEYELLQSMCAKYLGSGTNTGGPAPQ